MSKEAVQSPAGGEQSTIVQELQDAINGKPMTTDLREWCLERITSLAEYSDLDDPANSSDQELAKAVQGASLASVRSTFRESEALTKLRNDVLSKRIAGEYEESKDKPELIAFKNAVCWSRKFGFPIVCTLEGHSEAEQMNLAARVLIRVSGCWAEDDVTPMPDLLTPPEGTALHDDATNLIQRGLSSMKEALTHVG